MEMELDSLDRKILNLIQTGFPVDPEPYKVLGEKLNEDEDLIFQRVKKMREGGIIRRIGASFDSRGLGWVSTLCALKVPPDEIDKVVEVINSFPHVTHNYERADEYNVWFTIIAPSEEAIGEIIEEIESRSGVGPVRNMPMIQKFKIKVDFRFDESDERETSIESSSEARR